MGARIHLVKPYRASHVSGRGCTCPEGSSRRGAPSHVPVEAPCSALADDTAKERLCPYTYGSAMLPAGDKQLRATHDYINLREPRGQCVASTPPLGRATRGGWKRGLRSGRTRSGRAPAHATQPGLPDLGVAHPSRGLGKGKYGNCLHVKGDS